MLSGIFHDDALDYVCDMLAGVTAGFEPIENLRPGNRFDGVLAIQVKASHRFGVKAVPYLLQTVNLHDTVVEDRKSTRLNSSH